MRHSFTAAAAAVAIFCAAPAFAEGDSSLEARVARVEQRLADPCQASAREIQSSVDAYLSTARSDASLVGGCGSAGYDGGFWIRGGSFLLKINLTIQTRYESWNWDTEVVEAHPGGDLSGFSLPRVTLKFSGDATCSCHYYAELEFGHHGLLFDPANDNNSQGNPNANPNQNTLGFYYFDAVNHAFDAGETCREAWIECAASKALSFRMGLVKLPTTRQMMTPPEMQQFADISLASAFIGLHVPGYTDRNRDYGVMLHGVVGCDEAWSYLVTVTNGDGPVKRNILDQTTNDNLAYAARVNWDVKGHMGYEEGALRQHSCEWVASVGAWGYFYTDVLQDKSHTNFGNRTIWGVDAAAGYGGWSLTAAYTNTTIDESDLITGSVDGWSWLAQVGYLFPNSAWEVAARYSAYEDAGSASGSQTFGGDEWAGAVTYYIDGHSDKVTLDVAYVLSNDDGNIVSDVYAGYSAGVRGTTGGNFQSDGILVRLQWQLAL